MSRAITAQIWIWTYFVCRSFPKHASLSRKTIYQACSLRFFEYVPMRSLVPRHSWNGLSGCMEKHTHKNISEIKTTRLRFGSNKWQTRKKWVSGIIIWNLQWDDLFVVFHFFWLSESSFAHLLVPLYQEMDFRLKAFGPLEPKVPLKDDWNVSWHAECACVFLGNTMDSEVAPKGCIDKNSASNGRQYSSTCPVSRVSRRCFLFKSKGWDRTGRGLREVFVEISAQCLKDSWKQTQKKR